MKSLFNGGVHPADKKELTRGKSEISVIRPKEVLVPLSQHIGVACKPLVKVGDKVCVGQKIGDNEGMCVPVHASVSGTVTAIGPLMHPNGNFVPTIVIKNDFQDTVSEEVKTKVEPENLTAEELFETIREAGIIGMGGAAFPTDKKAISGMGKIDTLIVNACECEPYITADDALICMESENVLRGVRLLAQALKPGKTIIAMEDNKKKAAEVLRKYLNEFPEIELKILPTRYPQGAEKQLVRAVTGREVPPGCFPVSAGCIVFNVSTMAAVYRAIYEGMPLISRIVSVTGEGVVNPQNFIVPIGTPFSVLIEEAGGLTEGAKKIIAGGPMMGKAQETAEVPVVKGTGAVLCLEEDVQEEYPTCIRCGKCVSACPMNLQPLYLYSYENAGNLEMLDVLHLMDCMECGSCAYVCPGKLPLVEHFRSGKKALKEGRS